MAALTIRIDDRTAAELGALSAGCHATPSELAARLRRRSARAVRARPGYDIEAIAANSREFADEDLAIAEADADYSVELLAAEDRA